MHVYVAGLIFYIIEWWTVTTVVQELGYKIIITSRPCMLRVDLRGMLGVER